MNTMTKTAKVFRTGRSQAVRIPREFRFDTDEVLVAWQGRSVVLTPRRKMTATEFLRTCTVPDFELDRAAAQKAQKRELFA